MDRGREKFFPELDVSNVFGRFAMTCPFLLRIPENSDVAEIYDSISQQIAAIPNGGVGLALLKYCCKNMEIKRELVNFPMPEILFNYYVKHEDVVPGKVFGKIHILPERLHPSDIRQYKLYVVIEESLAGFSFTVGYSQNLHNHETIQNIIMAFTHGFDVMIS
jgi:hypothetical protein